MLESLFSSEGRVICSFITVCCEEEGRWNLGMQGLW